MTIPTVDVTSLDSADRDALLPIDPLAHQELDALIEELQASWQSGTILWDRRNGQRVNLSQTLELVPLDDGSERPCANSCEVLGVSLSREGVSFSHVAPLPYRKVRITLPIGGGRTRALVVRLKWCRFTKTGQYESGGQILRAH